MQHFFFFFGFIFETRTAYDRNTVIIIGEESQCFELIAADFETINVFGIFRLSWPLQGGKGSEQESC